MNNPKPDSTLSLHEYCLANFRDYNGLHTIAKPTVVMYRLQ